MKLIILHGILAKKFGKQFKLDVQSAFEASHALACQLPKFKKFMLDSESQGLKFAVFIGDKTKVKNLKQLGKNIGERELNDVTDKEVIHIVPQVVGAGGDAFNWLQVIAGAALVAFSGGLAAPNGLAMIGAGIGLMMGGVAGLLMPTPKLGQNDPDGNKANYGFGGAVTTVAQGNPVPILYGERDVGGFICSAGIYTEDSK